MPSIFPGFFNYSQLAPFILRLALGIILIRIGYKGGIIGIIRIAAAIFLFLGLFTQLAAILAVITCYKVREKKLALLMAAVGLSLLFLGPGILSFDLPL